MPLFCGEVVVSYRVADVAELEREASPTFLLRFVSLRSAFRYFVSLRVASLCFVLLRVAPRCFTLLPGSGLDSFWVFDPFHFILLRFASFRFASSLCFALVCFVLLSFAGVPTPPPP